MSRAPRTATSSSLAEIGSFEVSGRSMSMNDTDGTPVLQFMQG